MNPAGAQRSRLQALGIVRWRQRNRALDSVADTAPENQPPALLRAVDRCTATVLIEWSGQFDPDGSEPGPILLAKILAATGHKPSTFAVYQVTIEPPPAQGCTLWFTPRPVNPPPNTLLLPSLAAMLADPALKRTAWQHLKPWIHRLS